MNFASRASYVKSRRESNDGLRGSWRKGRGRWLFCLWVVRLEASGSGPRDDGGCGDDGEEESGVLGKGVWTCLDARPAVVEDEVTDWDRGHGCTGSRLCNTKSTTAVAMAAGECGDARELAAVNADRIACLGLPSCKRKIFGSRESAENIGARVAINLFS